MIRLRNLATDASLGIEVLTSGHVTASLLRKGREAQPVLETTGEDHLELTVVIRESGDYALIVDNGNGTTPQDYTVDIRASLKAPSGTRVELKSLQALMRRAFVFDTLQIETRHCPDQAEHRKPDTVLICPDYLAVLHEALNDEDLVSRNLSFNLIREIGRILLRQWQHPAHDNERFVDELATVFFVLFGQEENLRELAAALRETAPTPPNLATEASPLGEALTESRAARILTWLDDPDLLGEWQPTLVPHMQTALLEGLQKAPRDWTALQLVAEELNKRRASASS